MLEVRAQAEEILANRMEKAHLSQQMKLWGQLRMKRQGWERGLDIHMMRTSWLSFSITCFAFVLFGYIYLCRPHIKLGLWNWDSNEMGQFWDGQMVCITSDCQWGKPFWNTSPVLNIPLWYTSPWWTNFVYLKTFYKWDLLYHKNRRSTPSR